MMGSKSHLWKTFQIQNITLPVRRGSDVGHHVGSSEETLVSEMQVALSIASSQHSENTIPS